MGDKFYENEIKKLNNIIKSSNEVHDQIIVSYENEIKRLNEAIEVVRMKIYNINKYLADEKKRGKYKEIKKEDVLKKFNEILKEVDKIVKRWIYKIFRIKEFFIKKKNKKIKRTKVKTWKKSDFYKKYS